MSSKAEFETKMRALLIDDVEARRIRGLIADIAARRCEALRLYQPLPGPQEDFHRSTARELLAIGSNRSGKTTAPVVEVARAVTGQDPHGKYPARDGRCVIVGSDNKHISRTMYPKLFKAGAIRMIKDKDSGLWRSWEPWRPDDQARRTEAKLAPPMIPPRFIKTFAWENKKENVPSVINLTTGWEMYFYSSLGKPGRGFDVDLVWIDEEIVQSEWYKEMLARLLDRRGRIIWSATAQQGTEQMYEVHQRWLSARAEGKGNIIQEFQFDIDANPYIGQEEKEAFKWQMSDDDDAYRVRVEGGWAIEGYKVFPEFAYKIHIVEPFSIPHHWCRYAAVDPGRHVCGVAFLAVPPPSESDRVFLFDELYLRQCDAATFGREMGRKCEGQAFELFLIDPRSARAHEIGTGREIQEQYALALAANKVYSRRTQSNFLWGTDDERGSIEALRGWLKVRQDGTPRLAVLRTCENFIWEIERWRYRKVNDQPSETTVRKNDHLIDGMRYLAAFEPAYVKPKGGKRTAPVLAVFKAKQQKRRAKEGGEESFVNLGPNP